MFQKRRNQRKPAIELLNGFKEQYPELRAHVYEEDVARVQQNVPGSVDWMVLDTDLQYPGITPSNTTLGSNRISSQRKATELGTSEELFLKTFQIHAGEDVGCTSANTEVIISTQPAPLLQPALRSSFNKRQWHSANGQYRASIVAPSSASFHGLSTEKMSTTYTMGRVGRSCKWIKVVDVDESYRAPSSAPKIATCFHIQYRPRFMKDTKQYYRSIYLIERTLQTFNRCICAKWHLDITKILRTIWVVRDNVEVEVDDDVIQHLAEGQDMLLEVDEVVGDLDLATPRNEYSTLSLTAPPPTKNIILRLIF